MPLLLRKMLVFGLAVIGINALLFSGYVLGRISSWIVSHDMVNAQMDRDGAWLEHGVAEFLSDGGSVGLPFVVLLLGSVVFLVLLWHTLFRADQTRSLSDDAA